MNNSSNFGKAACVFAGLGLALSLEILGGHLFLFEQPNDYTFGIPFAVIGLVLGLIAAIRKEAKNGFYTYGIFFNALLILPVIIGYTQLGSTPHPITHFPFLAY